MPDKQTVGAALGKPLAELQYRGAIRPQLILILVT
jgi:hypothetical protein